MGYFRSRITIPASLFALSHDLVSLLAVNGTKIFIIYMAAQMVLLFILVSSFYTIVKKTFLAALILGILFMIGNYLKYQ